MDLSVFSCIATFDYSIEEIKDIFTTNTFSLSSSHSILIQKEEEEETQPSIIICLFHLYFYESTTNLDLYYPAEGLPLLLLLLVKLF